MAGSRPPAAKNTALLSLWLHTSSQRTYSAPCLTWVLALLTRRISTGTAPAAAIMRWLLAPASARAASSCSLCSCAAALRLRPRCCTSPRIWRARATEAGMAGSALSAAGWQEGGSVGGGGWRRWQRHGMACCCRANPGLLDPLGPPSPAVSFRGPALQGLGAVAGRPPAWEATCTPSKVLGARSDSDRVCWRQGRPHPCRAPLKRGVHALPRLPPLPPAAFDAVALLSRAAKRCKRGKLLQHFASDMQLRKACWEGAASKSTSRRSVCHSARQARSASAGSVTPQRRCARARASAAVRRRSRSSSGRRCTNAAPPRFRSALPQPAGRAPGRLRGWAPAATWRRSGRSWRPGRHTGAAWRGTSVAWHHAAGRG